MFCLYRKKITFVFELAIVSYFLWNFFQIFWWIHPYMCAHFQWNETFLASIAQCMHCGDRIRRMRIESCLLPAVFDRRGWRWRGLRRRSKEQTSIAKPHSRTWQGACEAYIESDSSFFIKSRKLTEWPEVTITRTDITLRNFFKRLTNWNESCWIHFF